MKIIRYLIAFTAVLYVVVSGTVTAEETITWFVHHRPPGMTLDASGKIITGGATGRQLLMIQSALKNYHHVNMQMNWGRFWNDVKQGKNICNSVSFKSPEREDIAEFSIPVAFILPMHFVLRKSTWVALGKPESISLVKMLGSTELKGGLIDKRSYSEQIDAVLLQHETSSGITRYVVDIHRLVLMLMHHRFDYTLEYPPAIDSVLSTLTPEERISEVVSVPVKEIGPYFYIYTACTKNEWGKQVITDLNAALLSLRKTGEYRDTMKEAYMGDQLERVMSIYNEQFIHSGVK